MNKRIRLDLECQNYPKEIYFFVSIDFAALLS